MISHERLMAVEASARLSESCASDEKRTFRRGDRGNRIHVDPEHSIWPYFWVAVAAWIGLALIRPAGVNPIGIAAALAALTALALLLVGTIQAIRRRRNE
jgi:hypothetical protein